MQIITILGKIFHTPEILQNKTTGKDYGTFQISMYQGKNQDNSYKPSVWYKIICTVDQCRKYSKGDEVMVSGQVTIDGKIDKNGKVTMNATFMYPSISLPPKRDNTNADINHIPDGSLLSDNIDDPTVCPF